MAVALPAPTGGGLNTSGKRPVRTQPSRAVPHSGQRGDRNPFTTSPPTSPFPRAAPQDILRRCLLLYPVTPVQAALCRSIPAPQALRRICRARPGALQSCGREWGVRRSSGGHARGEIAQKTACGVPIRPWRESAGRRLGQKVGGSKGSSGL
jgi:hypothetical protein